MKELMVWSIEPDDASEVVVRGELIELCFENPGEREIRVVSGPRQKMVDLAKEILAQATNKGTP